MKRKIRYAAATALTLVLLLLSGCVRIEGALTIKPSGKADFRLQYAALESLTGQDVTLSEDAVAELVEEGLDYELYSDEDGYVGYVITAEDRDLAELLGPADETGKTTPVGGFLDSCEVTTDGSVVNARLKLAGMGTAGTSGVMLSGIETYGGYIRFTVTLPTKALEHNASSVSEDGKTLTWDLLRLPDGEIRFSFRRTVRKGFIAAVAVGAGLLLSVPAVVIPLSVSAKKRRARLAAAREAELLAQQTPPMPFAGGKCWCAGCGAEMEVWKRFCSRCGRPNPVAAPKSEETNESTPEE